jgi:hypothetical protein
MVKVIQLMLNLILVKIVTVRDLLKEKGIYLFLVLLVKKLFVKNVMVKVRFLIKNVIIVKGKDIYKKQKKKQLIFL